MGIGRLDVTHRYPDTTMTDTIAQPDTHLVIPDHIVRLIGEQFINGMSVTDISARAGMRRDTIERVLRSQMVQMIRLLPGAFFVPPEEATKQ